MTLVLQHPKKTKPRVAVQYLKGEVSTVDFTAKVFTSELKNGKWRLAGSYIETLATTNKVQHARPKSSKKCECNPQAYTGIINQVITYKIQLDIPESYTKGVYKLQDHPDIVITYTTTDLDNPLLKYIGEGLLDLVVVDPANGHIQGGLSGGVTLEDGDGLVLNITFLFSFG
ncbi:hypothetical protein HF257_26560 [Pseudomonas sp. WS 5106]|uniref:Uncharacterized protein n=1 Tax=Pseudomonas cremoris TaxID=2724178 RepID=A0A7X1E109_9PSED|nr:hypothetical protein [Pseudomonas cremoris]MBC2383227.1 hypothetical protein [Pseudomonas cremoris]MBC2409583.1 hypothetical protein [Pseudomonas cremoris]